MSGGLEEHTGEKDKCGCKITVEEWNKFTDYKWGYLWNDLPPKKWTQRRVGVSIKAGS